MLRIEKTLLLLLTVCSVLLSGCADKNVSKDEELQDIADLQESEILKVGVRDDISNFSTFNENTGKFYGLEIDMAEALAERMGYKGVEFIVTKPSSREDDLDSGKVDAVIALYSVTEERKDKVDFTVPYYHDHLQVIVENTTLFGKLEDLKGINIAVQEGSSSENLLVSSMVSSKIYDSAEEAYGSLKFSYFSSYEEMFTALETGEVDALCADGCIAHQYMNEERKSIADLSDIYYAAAAKKGSELSESLGAAVNEIISDGTLDAITEKWSY